MKELAGQASAMLDRFLFETTQRRACVRMRVAFAGLLIVYTTIWLLDGPMWFSDTGVLQAETAKQLSTGPPWALFHWLPATPAIVNAGLTIMLLQSVCLLLGIFSRLQAACLFVWLASFQSRNPMLGDGEDAIFRMFAFFLIWMPLDHAWSLSGYLLKRFRERAGRIDRRTADHDSAWAIRLPQIQMTLIYFSAAWSKLLGSPWRDGSAMFYVYRLDDIFGRGPLPTALLESETLIRLTTWSVVTIEACLPLALWYRRTRWLAIVVGIGLHLSIEYTMHLFLFQWLMIVGLLSFMDLRSRCR